MRKSVSIAWVICFLIIVPSLFICGQSNAGDLKWELVLQVAKKFNRVDISSNGDCAAGATRSKEIYAWRKPFSDPPKIITIESNAKKIISLGFFGKQDDLFVALSDGLVQIWDKGLAKKKFEYRFPSKGFVAAISEDGRFIGHANAFLDREKDKHVAGEAFKVQSGLSIAAPSRCLTTGSGSDDRRLILSDMKNGEMVKKEVPYPPTACTLSHNGQYALGLVTHGKSEAYLWDISKDHLAPITLNPSMRMFFAGFSPDDSWFLAAGFNGFDVIQTHGMKKLFGAKAGMCAAHIASNTLFAVGGLKGEVEIWSKKTGKMLGRHSANSGPINSVKLCPQAGMLLTGGSKEFTMFRLKGL